MLYSDLNCNSLCNYGCDGSCDASCSCACYYGYCNSCCDTSCDSSCNSGCTASCTSGCDTLCDICPRSSSTNRTGLIVGVLCGVGFLVAAIVVPAIWFDRRRKSQAQVCTKLYLKYVFCCSGINFGFQNDLFYY